MLWWVCSFHASTCISHPQLVTANHSSSSMKACRMYALHIYRIYTWSFCFESLTRTMQEMLWAALLEPAVWGDDESPKPVENAPDCCRVVGFVLVFQYWRTLKNARSWEENWALPLVCCITRRPTIWIADRKLLVEGCLMTRWSTVSAALRHPSVLCVHRRVSRKSEGKLHASFQHLQLVMSGRRVGWLGTTRGAELSIKSLKPFEKPSWMAGVWWAACCNLAVLCEALKCEHWIKETWMDVFFGSFTFDRFVENLMTFVDSLEASWRLCSRVLDQLHNQNVENAPDLMRWVSQCGTVDGRNPKQPPAIYKTL